MSSSQDSYVTGLQCRSLKPHLATAPYQHNMYYQTHSIQMEE